VRWQRREGGGKGYFLPKLAHRRVYNATRPVRREDERTGATDDMSAVIVEHRGIAAHHDTVYGCTTLDNAVAGEHGVSANVVLAVADDVDDRPSGTERTIGEQAPGVVDGARDVGEATFCERRFGSGRVNVDRHFLLEHVGGSQRVAFRGNQHPVDNCKLKVVPGKNRHPNSAVAAALYHRKDFR